LTKYQELKDMRTAKTILLTNCRSRFNCRSGFFIKGCVRMSDFKSNEYANLIGGKYFEPDEENPMIGFRGASRYYSDFIEKGLH
jgi:phosphoenolpyruvate synthase/pyruvate phosphate dikinase